MTVRSRQLVGGLRSCGYRVAGRRSPAGSAPREAQHHLTSGPIPSPARSIGRTRRPRWRQPAPGENIVAAAATVVVRAITLEAVPLELIGKVVVAKPVGRSSDSAL